MKKSTTIKAELLQLIQQKMLEHHLSLNDFARKLELSPSAVSRMLEGNNMTLERLHEISLIFNYNFFRVWSDQLEIDQPESADIRRVKELEIANATLIKVIKS